MYKSLGGYNWNGLYSEPDPLECPISMKPSSIDNDSSESITKSAQEFHLALENLKSVSKHLKVEFIKLN